jgi:hypothetical protein
MSHRFLAALTVSALFVSDGVVARGHHSVNAQFDFDKPLAFEAVVVKLEIVNPHSVLHVERTNPDGSKTTWQFLTLAAGALRQRGLTRTSSSDGLRPGQVISIEGLAARNGQPLGFLTKLTMPDGRLIQTWFGDPNGN